MDWIWIILPAIGGEQLPEKVDFVLLASATGTKRQRVLSVGLRAVWDLAFAFLGIKKNDRDQTGHKSFTDSTLI